jgi:hypothetical protein
MATESENRGVKLNSQMLLLATWLWIFACTISVGIFGGMASVPTDRYARPGDFVISFTLGGMIGGIISVKFLPSVIRRGKIGLALSLFLPVLGIILVVSYVVELGVLFILSILGVLGSAYVVWIPRWTKRLREKTHAGCRVVAFALALGVLNTFFILVIFISMALMCC